MRYGYFNNDTELMRKRRKEHERWKSECRKRAKEDFMLYQQNVSEWRKQFNGDAKRLAKAEAMMKRKNDLRNRLHNT